jgi:hypothetical protein
MSRTKLWLWWSVALLPSVACTQGDDAASASEGTGSTTSSTTDATTDATTSGTTGPSTSSTTDPGETTGEPVDPPPEPSGNALDQDTLFMCVGAPAMPPTDLRLLDRREWYRGVGSDAKSQLRNVPLYPLPNHRYSSYSDGDNIDPSVLSFYLDVVSDAGVAWTIGKYNAGSIRTVNEDPETQCFLKDVAPSAECTRYFVRRFLERGALFRPASDEQVDALFELAEAELAGELDVNQRSGTILKIASAAWMTAGALFRPEMGAGQPDEHGRLRLSDWELAQAIAHALSRAPAGAPSVKLPQSGGFSPGTVDGDLPEFLAAAESGEIKDPEVIAALVRKYVGGLDEERFDTRLDPGYHESRGEYWMAAGVVAFFREWLGYGYLAQLSPKVEVSATSQWSGSTVELSYHNTINGSKGRENTLITQLDDMIARIIAADTNVFSELLTSRMFYTPATAGYQQGESSIYKSTAEMNRVYNVQQVTPQTREARWIELPAQERAGVLTHPAWLGAHALAFENDPNLVHRGKWIREELLCQDIPPLPLNVDAMLSEESQQHSARKRISEQLDAKPECSACHQYMNPLGYPFEIYNHAGFVRIEDHGAAPDGSSLLVDMPSPELNGPISSAVDLSQRLGASPYAKRCFIRQTFRYFAGREERMYDACTLAAMEEAYDSSGGSFTELLIALFNSDSFQYRSPQ